MAGHVSDPMAQRPAVRHGELYARSGRATRGIKMTNQEFERLDRQERLATLKFVADRDGLDSQLYQSLAAQHQFLLLGRTTRHYRKAGKWDQIT
jgi:hypothetical protein